MDFIKKVVNKEGKELSPDFSGKIVGLYFSAHWCPPCRGFTPKLSEKFTKLKSEGKPFEIIFVSADEDEESAKSYFNEMSWDMMLPFDDQETKDLLDQKYEVSGIPTLVIVNGDTGVTITDDGRSALFEVEFDSLAKYGEEKAKKDAEKKAKLDQLKENFDLSKVFTDSSIKDKEGKDVSLSSFKDKVLGIYFSAHWCPPCRGFTPKLAEKYNDLIAENKQFDIVFVSSDRDSNSAAEYFAEMPWKMLKYEDRDTKALLGELYNVSGIPTLVLIDLASGKLISTDGRSDLFSKNIDELRKQSSVFGFA